MTNDKHTGSSFESFLQDEGTLDEVTAVAVQRVEEWNVWKETVRKIFDTLHFDEDSIFTGSRLAKRLIALIEERHHAYFCEPVE